MSEPVTRPAPFSLRLTPEVRAQLERDAAGMPLGAYILSRVCEGAPPRRRGQTPVKDHIALSTLLGLFGQSRIPNNVNQLAKAVHSGSLVLTPEVEADLREAVRHIAEIRRLLILALGLTDGAS